MRLVQFAHGAWVWCMVTVVLGCGGASEDEGAAANNDIRQVRLMSHYDSVLSIGPEGAIQEYPYDARGPGSFGTMRAVSQGRADLVFPAESMYVTDLYFIPGVPVYVDIVPRDMVGTIDFCTGHVDLSYDALFRPMVFGRPQEPLSVVTTLTTGTSSGLFRQVTGRPLDERGDLRLVSVAVVPETGNPFINKALSLPTDAVSELEQHLDFPEGRLRCPGHHEEGTARKVHMAVGKDGRLSISFLGSFPEFAYDGKGSDGIGLLGPVVDGRSSVTFSEFHVPPLQFIPGADSIRVDIVPHQLSGEIDFCTGLIELDFDATFTPIVGGREMTSISIVTTITTDTSSGYTRTVTGRRLDPWGDAVLVGVAKVPVTDDPLVNFMLDLPNDAVCELPVHLDFVGGSRPVCL